MVVMCEVVGYQEMAQYQLLKCARQQTEGNFSLMHG